VITWVAVPTARADGSAGWVTVCTFDHRLQADPIVAPGEVSAHLHDFFGNQSTDADSTYRSLLAARHTSCAIAKDKAAYWVPTLYVKTADGSLRAVEPSEANFYYRVITRPRRKVQPFPRGLKMIAGDAHATAPQSTSIVYWGCDDGSSDSQDHPPDCGSANVTAHINFPDCWDGVHIDSADHMGHMALSIDPDDDGRYQCPRRHPVPVPRLIFALRWPVNDGSNVELSSGAPYTMHGDFFNAWVQSMLRRLVRRCIRANRDCGKPGG
jgi:Domain of unknown function (DUF1996)